ncbi:outer membrane beta-barrel protein [Pseudoalteromonas tunicata]|uniref:Outer membrane protein beta-barrel domain-containing protein n=1 Tax=Pseudoalteromonas tunicata D2 TaxID=87626 RepID=A4CB02_9GAMM|nr:outer membrane beta-barrel protein [Pseudoalteromonas tunicata]AXT30737.1 hypothetical protein D1819_07840 [Pseudoalteromonas tunicata]EAR28560.1 hypothetical protein PTD2_22132 [Pseudoalteromonas tunicata D2]
MKLFITAFVFVMCVFQSAAASFNDDFIKVGAISTRIADVNGLKLQGTNLEGRKQFGHWFGLMQWSQQADSLSETAFYDATVDESDYINEPFKLTFDFNRYSVGLGRYVSLSEQTQLDFSALYGKMVFKLSLNEFAERNQTNTLNLNIQLRHFITAQIELNAGLSYERFSDNFADNSLVYRLGAEYYFAQSWSLSVYFRNVGSASFSSEALSVSANNDKEDYYRDLALMLGYRF